MLQNESLATARGTSSSAAPQRAAANPSGVARDAGFDALYVSHPKSVLASILAAYLIVAVLFAVKTPPWQAPDEPAHYNYVASIAATGSLPVLHMGDYDQLLLAQLVNLNFPPGLGIERLRYESYQPPLTYLTATPVFWLTNGSLLALRLYNVVLGLLTLILLFLCLETVFPLKPLIPLTATAFAAVLPMHVAVAASFNNDMMAELLIMAAFLVLLRWMRGFYYGHPVQPVGLKMLHRWPFAHPLLMLGLLLGLGMVTKIYAYAALPIVLLAVLWTLCHKCESMVRLRYASVQAVLVIGPALVVVAPLWLRNVWVYGSWDILGTIWHDQVVVGQPRTGEWIAHYGLVAYFERAYNLTFNSFWGVFGWLSIFMDERIYTAAMIFAGALFLGLVWATVRLISGAPDTDMDEFQVTAIALFAILLAAVFASYIWYNLKFVQHQGRYFFWGMLSIGTLVALGWREVLHPVQGTITGLLALVLAGSLTLVGVLDGTLDKWTVLMVSVMAFALLGQPLLLVRRTSEPTTRLARAAAHVSQQPVVMKMLGIARFGVWVSPFVALFVLDLLIPSFYILPQLGIK